MMFVGSVGTLKMAVYMTSPLQQYCSNLSELDMADNLRRGREQKDEDHPSGVDGTPGSILQ